jgi:hypothetical protein
MTMDLLQCSPGKNMDNSTEEDIEPVSGPVPDPVYQYSSSSGTNLPVLLILRYQSTSTPLPQVPVYQYYSSSGTSLPVLLFLRYQSTRTTHPQVPVYQCSSSSGTSLPVLLFLRYQSTSTPSSQV